MNNLGYSPIYTYLGINLRGFMAPRAASDFSTSIFTTQSFETNLKTTHGNLHCCQIPNAENKEQKTIESPPLPEILEHPKMSLFYTIAHIQEKSEWFLYHLTTELQSC